MIKQLYQYMDKVFYFEKNGYIDEALQLCNKCMQAFPDHKNEINLEIAKISYRGKRKEEALVQLLELYQETNKIEIRDLILELYYYINHQEYNKRYQDNCKRLKSYAYFKGTKNFLETHYWPIWFGKNIIYFYDDIEKKFKMIEHHKIIIEKPMDEVCIGSNLLWKEDILFLERMTRKIDPYMDEENALLLVYQKETWELLLQLFDLEELLKLDRILFYNNIDKLQQSFIEDGISFPSIVVGDLSDKIAEICKSTYKYFLQECSTYQLEVKKYYKENSNNIIKHIKEGKPKILFITTRFSTALQYHIRDCKEAAESMGLETEILIEKNRFKIGTNLLLVMKKIAELKPDIIFVLDHFRYEQDYLKVLDEIVYVCWIQDTLPWIFSKETVLKQKDRDIVISIFYNWKEFQKLGYNKQRLLPSPMVANHNIYHSYILNDEERMAYECDICLLCHACDVDGYVKSFINNYDGNCKLFIEDLYQSYIDYVRTTTNIFMKLEEFSCFIQMFAEKFYRIKLKSDFVNKIAEEMRTGLNTRLYRTLIVDWLIEAGYTNIKLWGNEWEHIEKYKSYAMGPAKNGETLSKILQSCKIVIGNNVVLSGGSRVAETLLSGAFYMANYIPPEDDTCDIRQWLKEGEEIVFFKSKKDLLDKVQFYLNNDVERIRMVKIGQQRALEKLTYQKFMQDVVKGIGDMF